MDKDNKQRVVLDTNVLIDAPEAVFMYDSIVLPYTVLAELDNHKRNPDLKRQAQAAIKCINEGINKGIIEVVDLPTEDSSPDERIVRACKDNNAMFVTQDIGAKCIAKAQGVHIGEESTDDSIDYSYTGYIEIDASNDTDYEMHWKHLKEVMPIETLEKFNVDLMLNQYMIVNRIGGAVDIWRESQGKIVRISQSIKPLRSAGLIDSPLDAQQQCAIDAVMNPEVPLTVIDGGLGVGKEQPLSANILTPTGWKKMGDINTGDLVIGSKGLPIEVLGTYPQGIKDVYKIDFIDGTSVECGLEHLWGVYTPKNKYKVVSVKDMLKHPLVKKTFDKRYGTYQNNYQLAIPLSAPCVYGTDETLPLDPYLLGLLLGDGGMSQDTISFTNANINIINEVKKRLPVAYTIGVLSFNKGAWHCNISMANGVHTEIKPFRHILETLGLHGKLSVDKHIPDIYKNATLQSRKALIQGLIDTDGYVVNNKLVEFSTSSDKLAKDFLEVARSIGMVVSIKDRIPKYTYKGEVLEGMKSYRIRELTKTKKSIVGITKIRKEESKCLYVDSKDHLYVTDGYNLTHNTVLVLMGALATTRGQKNYRFYKKILVTRPPIATDRKLELGFLPGDLSQKLGDWVGGVKSNLKFLYEKDLETSLNKSADSIFEEHFELLNLESVQGVSLHNVILLVDEYQLLNTDTLKLVLSRIAQGAKVVLVGDTQGQTYGINRSNEGFRTLYKYLGKNSNMNFIKLNNIYRSKLSEFVDEVFK